MVKLSGKRLIGGFSNMKNRIKSLTLISAVALIAVVAITAVIGILVFTDTIKWDSSPYLIMFALLSLGIGGYTLGLSFFIKSNSALCVGAIVFDVGLICFLITLNVLIGIIIAVGVAVILIAFILLLALNAKTVSEGLKTSDKEEGYVPYMEQLAKDKEREETKEKELPTIKSLKD